MPDTSPTPVDRLQEARNQVCAKFCHAHRDDHHWVCRTIDAELATRASIGPDSERIRELEAENERQKWLLREYDVAFDNLLGAHAEVNMDTDEDRALHSRTMSAFEDLQTALRAGAS